MGLLSVVLRFHRGRPVFPHSTMELVVAVLALGAVAVKSVAGYECAYCQPQQLRLAFGEKPNDIVVTWTTYNDTSESVVKYGDVKPTLRAYGNSTRFADGGRSDFFQFVHRVTLPDLQYNTTYVYTVGSKYGISERFQFHVPPAGDQWPLRVCIYGDMGVVNAVSLSSLQEETQDGNFDLVMHIGDFGYNMNDNHSRWGDQFMRQIQPIAAYVPYMTCVGNHEHKYNFSNYRERFSMPGGTDNMYYSFDLGPVHFVVISTEFYYFLEDDPSPPSQIRTQYEWLQNDLAKANREENRAVRPWIVLSGHRPMYCTNAEPADMKECAHEVTRAGHDKYGYGLEPLLKQYGVDIAFWAHEHSYERSWPLYNFTVYNGSLAEPYTNPGAPVHIITGSPGMYSGHDWYNNSLPRPAWSASRTDDYGYTRFVVHNHSHFYLEQVNVETGGEVVDSIWVVKHSHGEFCYD